MQTTIGILGRQPAIGLAELESVFGAEVVRPIGNYAVELQTEPKSFSIDRFGGLQKAGQLLTYLDTTKWSELVAYVKRTLPDHLGYFPEGKLRIGLSVYGLSVSIRELNAAGLTLKKLAVKHGRSARVVPNKTSELNSAQVLHNQLTGPTGLELLFIRDGQRTILAQCVAVQDITAYTRRDQERPKRDAKVGMLPPKLAQTICNLAVGNATSGVVLDPFCGTGVLLQEALLMGFSAYGTDLESRMIDYSQQNLEWLRSRISGLQTSELAKADATKNTWEKPFDFIAAETFLGTPLVKLPTPPELAKLVPPVDELHRATLENIARQTEKGFRLCLGVPAWRTNRGFHHLPCLDDLEKLGYTRLKFVHAREADLIYNRDDQFVGRELVVLVRS